MSYRMDPAAPLAGETRRIAKAELNAALSWLSSVSDDPDKAFHEARKRLKNVRALLALVRTGDKVLVRAENDRCRGAAASLAGPRQAGALIETIDRLAKAFPEGADSEAIGAARKRLLAHRSDVLSVDMHEAVDAAAAACRTCMDRLEALVLPDRPEDAADIVAAGATRALRRAQKAVRRARRDGREEAFHGLRKAAKVHLAHLSLLGDFWPSRVRERKREVAALAEKLGELQDLFVLRAQIHEGIAGKPSLRLMRLCRRSERKLRRKCVAQAEKLFDDEPSRPALKLARRFLAGAGGLQPLRA